MASYILTLTAEDRPGLIASLSSMVADSGGNWLESRLTRLSGKFAGVVLIDLAETALPALKAAVKNLAAQQHIKVEIEPASAPPITSSHTQALLELISHDRPGIVREVTDLLARLHVNVEDFETSVASASFSGEPMFRARAQLLLPAGLNERALKAELENLSNDLMADFCVKG